MRAPSPDIAALIRATPWNAYATTALPHILSGIRVTVPVELIITFTTEMIAGGGGVGAALMFAQRFFQTPTVFVYILVMLATGLIFDRAMLVLRGRLIPWQDEMEEA